MVHLARATAQGIEQRSRYWIGHDPRLRLLGGLPVDGLATALGFKRRLAGERVAYEQFLHDQNEVHPPGHVPARPVPGVRRRVRCARLADLDLLPPIAPSAASAYSASPASPQTVGRGSTESLETQRPQKTRREGEPPSREGASEEEQSSDVCFLAALRLGGSPPLWGSCQLLSAGSGQGAHGRTLAERRDAPSCERSPPSWQKGALALQEDALSSRDSGLSSQEGPLSSQGSAL